MGPYCRVCCEENVVVDFFLNGHNVESMDIFIYHPEHVECFYMAQSLIGIITIRIEEIMFEVYPNDYELFRYYQIGFNCVKNVLNYPCAILG